MKRGRLPLTALRSFEVAGRLQSFTLAAAELYISQAAVSRQVRELETLLGQPLFARQHRRVSLTHAGEKLLASLTASFDDIGDCLDGLKSRDAISAVSVSAEPSFASCWLVPHLAEFQKDHPHIDIQLDADSRLIEFRNGQASLAIRHSAQSTGWKRTESQHLCDVKLSPVVAPDLLVRATAVSSPADLLRFPLLHEENRDLWRHWFEAAGVVAEIERGPVYADGGLVLQAALRGQGIALMDKIFAEEDVAAGRLVRPFDISVSHGAYWLVSRRFDRLPDAASAFARWLRENIASSSA